MSWGEYKLAVVPQDIEVDEHADDALNVLKARMGGGN